MQNICLNEWESGSAFRAHFESPGGRSLVVGNAAESPRRFYSCVIASVAGPTEVGVVSSDLGSAPAAVVLYQGHILIVGHDTWLTWVNLDKPAFERDRRLGGVFFEFLPTGNDEVVVVHELGVIRVDSRGGAAWNVDTDVIEDYRIDAAGNLILSIMDEGSPLAVGLESGRVAR
jgi:hypothetical protein